MTARVRTGRTCSSGCSKSLARRVALRWMRYSRRENGAAAMAACCALRIFDAATICIARVIWAVELIERMRRRRSRGEAIATLSRSA